MKRIIIFSFFLIFFIGCFGFPKRITIEKKRMISSIESINLIIESSELNEIKPEVLERFNIIFQEQLAKKNIKLNAHSNYSLKVVFKRYEDGNLLIRGVTGSILGINIGKLAKIEAQVQVLENQKEITKATVLVESSRSGWNFSHGYGGARNLEKAFVKEVIKIFL